MMHTVQYSGVLQVVVSITVGLCANTEDDWEASHLAKLGGEGVPLPDEGLHHDDAILGAITTTTAVGQNGSHTPKSSSAVGEVSGTPL